MADTVGLKRTAYATASGQPQTGTVSRAETNVDWTNHVVPMEQVQGRLHGSGVCQGLEVTATRDAASLRVLPGVAVSPSGRHIWLAAGAPARVGTTGVTVPGADGVRVPTSGDGERLVVLTWNERITTGNQVEHCPILTVENATVTPGPDAVVLAAVTLTAGAVTALTAGTRSGPRPVTAGLTVQRSSVGDDAGLLGVAQTGAAEIGPLDGGGLLLTADRVVASGLLDGRSGVVAGGVVAGRDADEVDYQWEYETVGVRVKDFNLRLQSPNAVFVHTGGGGATSPAQRIEFDAGGNIRMERPAMLLMGHTDGSGTAPGEVVGGIGFRGDGIQHGQLSFRAGSGFELVDRSGGLPGLDHARDQVPYADLTLRGADVRGKLTVAGTQTVDGDATIRGSAAVGGTLNVGAVINTPSATVTTLQSGGPVSRDGTVRVFGNIVMQARGSDVANGFPNWSGGGLLTHDVFARGALYVGGNPQSPAVEIYANGTLKAKTKNFRITHPQNPARALVHGCVEGPEHTVTYRGRARLTGGRARVTLPAYFESLTRYEGRTVQVTPVLADGATVSPLGASEVTGGAFEVRTLDGGTGGGEFCWQVTAVRADVEPLVAEPEPKLAEAAVG